MFDNFVNLLSQLSYVNMGDGTYAHPTRPTVYVVASGDQWVARTNGRDYDRPSALLSAIR
jgi:hypothetical protein